jgi:hypothetical protein
MSTVDLLSIRLSSNWSRVLPTLPALAAQVDCSAIER